MKTFKSLASLAQKQRKQSDESRDDSTKPTRNTAAIPRKTSQMKPPPPPMARYFQLFDKEGDPFYFDIGSGEVLWTLPGEVDFLDSVMYLSHIHESGRFYENVKTMEVNWEPPMDDISPDLRETFFNLLDINRFDLEGLIGVTFSLGESLEQFRLLEEYLIELDTKRAEGKDNNGESSTSRPSSSRMPPATGSPRPTKTQSTKISFASSKEKDTSATTASEVESNAVEVLKSSHSLVSQSARMPEDTKQTPSPVTSLPKPFQFVINSSQSSDEESDDSADPKPVPTSQLKPPPQPTSVDTKTPINQNVTQNKPFIIDEKPIAETKEKGNVTQSKPSPSPQFKKWKLVAKPSSKTNQGTEVDDRAIAIDSSMKNTAQGTPVSTIASEAASVEATNPIKPPPPRPPGPPAISKPPPPPRPLSTASDPVRNSEAQSQSQTDLKPPPPPPPLIPPTENSLTAALNDISKNMPDQSKAPPPPPPKAISSQSRPFLQDISNRNKDAAKPPPPLPPPRPKSLEIAAETTSQLSSKPPPPQRAQSQDLRPPPPFLKDISTKTAPPPPPCGPPPGTNGDSAAASTLSSPNQSSVQENSKSVVNSNNDIISSKAPFLRDIVKRKSNDDANAVELSTETTPQQSSTNISVPNVNKPVHQPLSAVASLPIALDATELMSSSPSVTSGPTALTQPKPPAISVEDLQLMVDEFRTLYDRRDKEYAALRAGVASIYSHPAAGHSTQDKSVTDDHMIRVIQTMIENLVNHNKSIDEKARADQSRIQDLNRRLVEETNAVHTLTDETKRLQETVKQLNQQIQGVQNQLRLVEEQKRAEVQSLSSALQAAKNETKSQVEETKAEFTERLRFLEKYNEDLIEEINHGTFGSRGPGRVGTDPPSGAMTRVPFAENAVSSSVSDQISPRGLFAVDRSESKEFRRRDESVVPMSMHTKVLNELQNQLDDALMRLSQFEGSSMHPDESHSNLHPTDPYGEVILQSPKSILAANNPDTRVREMWSSSLLLTSKNDDMSTSRPVSPAHNSHQQWRNSAIPTEFIRRQSRLYPSSQVMQHFPLELSNLDYFNRIFFIVASGLRPIVTELLKQRVKLLDAALPRPVMKTTVESIEQSRSNAGLAEKTSKKPPFQVYFGESGRRRFQASPDPSKRGSSTIAADDSLDPLLLTDLQSPDPYSSGSPYTYENYMKQRHFMRLSTRILSLEEMMVVILALRIDPESRTAVLGQHAQQLGFRTINEMIEPMNLLLQWCRFVQRQSASAMLDTGKLGNFADVFRLCRSVLEPMTDSHGDSSWTFPNRSVTPSSSNYSQAATLAINELTNLENQIIAHSRWKEGRMLEMGWIFDDSYDVFVQFQTMVASSIMGDRASSSSFTGFVSPKPRPRLSSSPMSLSPIPFNENGKHTFPVDSQSRIPSAGRSTSPMTSDIATDKSAFKSIDSPYASLVNRSIKQNPAPTLRPPNGASSQTLSAEKAMMLYDSLKAKLFSLLTPQEIAVSKIVIRLLGFMDYLRPQIRKINDELTELSKRSDFMLSSYMNQQRQTELGQSYDYYIGLYRSMKVILNSFREKKSINRRRSTFLWSYSGSVASLTGDDSMMSGDQESKAPDINYLGDQRVQGVDNDEEGGDTDEIFDDHPTNHFYTHPRLRRLHRLLFKSSDTLIKLGVIVNEGSSSASLARDERTEMSMISSEKVKDILNIHRDLQNLLVPFDASSAITTYLSSVSTASSISSSLKGSNTGRFRDPSQSSGFENGVDADANEGRIVTANLIYRVTSHLDGHSIASLLLVSGSKDYIQTFYSNLFGLTVPIPSNQGGESRAALTEAAGLNIMDLDLSDAISCREHGFLCSELRQSKLFSNNDILKARYPLSELVGMNFNVDDLRIAGYSIQQCKAIGMDAAEIRAGGFSDLAIIREGGFTWNEIRSAGLDITRFILIQLFESCGGANWRRKDNWTTERPLSEWQGVFLNGAKKVFKLDLRGNNLTGEIPDILGLLTSLEHLDLYNNHLRGPIPESLTRLKNLRELWLNDNDLDVTPYTRPMLQSALPKCKIRL